MKHLAIGVTILLLIWLFVSMSCAESGSLDYPPAAAAESHKMQEAVRKCVYEACKGKLCIDLAGIEQDCYRRTVGK